MEDTVKNILKSLNIKIENDCEKRELILVQPVFIKESMFDKYRQSKFSALLKKLKYLPIVGDILIIVKRKILKWDL
jgi:hypothetical protein